MNQTGNQLYTSTHQQIQENFLSLLETKELSHITIREICLKAQINRSTFYRHYEDIFALMQDIEHKIFTEFMSNIKSRFSSNKQLSEEHFVEVLHHIKKYAGFYSAFLSNGVQEIIFDKYPEIWDHFLVSTFQRYGVVAERHMHYYFSFFKAGFLFCITKWLEEGCPESPEELAHIIWKYSMHSID